MTAPAAAAAAAAAGAAPPPPPPPPPRIPSVAEEEEGWVAAVVFSNSFGSLGSRASPGMGLRAEAHCLAAAHGGLEDAGGERGEGHEESMAVLLRYCATLAVAMEAPWLVRHLPSSRSLPGAAGG